jgi:hypothetical protein
MAGKELRPLLAIDLARFADEFRLRVSPHVTLRPQAGTKNCMKKNMCYWGLRAMEALCPYYHAKKAKSASGKPRLRLAGYRPLLTIDFARFADEFRIGK